MSKQIDSLQRFLVARFWFTFAIFATIFFSGCATDIRSLEKFAHIYYEQDAKNASEFALKKADSKDLLWNLQAGISAYTANNPNALDLLEKSENLFSKYEGEGLLTKGGAQAGATLVNDNAMSYRGNMYEGVFLNYYKALAQMETSNADSINSTRVELNRANDRQRHAKDYYAKQINKAINDENERYAQSSARGVVDRENSQRRASRELESTYANLAQFRAFDGFINPAVSYISGLFFALQGDSKGIDYLKESYGITQSETIAQDLLYFSSTDFEANLKSSKEFLTTLSSSQSEVNNADLDLLDSSKFYTWIILEEGRQMRKSEFRFSLPLITTNGLYHFGIALPQLKDGISFAKHYTIESKQNSTQSSQDFNKSDSSEFFELANTDKIIATEFEKQLNAILARAFVSASLKVATQLGLSKGLGQVNSGLGLLGSIFGSAYSALSTNADLRIASVLPKRILLAKIPNTMTKQTTKAKKDSSEFAIYADKSSIATLDFTLQSCQTILHTTSTDDTTKEITHKKHAKNPALSLCPYTHNIIYLRHTKSKTYYKILFSR